MSIQRLSEGRCADCTEYSTVPHAAKCRGSHATDTWLSGLQSRASHVTVLKLQCVCCCYPVQLQVHDNASLPQYDCDVRPRTLLNQSQ